MAATHFLERSAHRISHPVETAAEHPVAAVGGFTLVLLVTLVAYLVLPGLGRYIRMLRM